MIKNTQITLFVIIALVIVVIVVGFFIFNNKNSSYLYNSNVQLVKNNVEFCLINISRNAIDLVSMFGGNYVLSSIENTSNLASFLPVYNQDPPNKVILESNIAYLIDNNLLTCMTKFKNYSFSVNFGKSYSRVFLNSKTARVGTEMMTSMVLGEERYALKNYEVIINTNLSLLYSLAVEFSNSNYFNDGSVCISCIENFSSSNNLLINTLDLGDSMLVNFAYPVDNLNNSEIFNFIIK